MHNFSFMGNINESAFIVTIKDMVNSVSQGFLDMTGYSLDDLINKNISEVFNILRIGPNLVIENNNGEEEYFLFTRSLEVRFFHIEIIEKDDNKIYTLREILNSRLEDKHVYLSQLCESNIIGIAVYSVPDLVLIKANQKYLDFLEAPFNKKDSSLGKKVQEIIPGWYGSCAELSVQKAIAKRETLQLEEYGYKGYKRGITYWDSIITPIIENGNVTCVICTTKEVTENVANRIKNKEQAKIIDLKNKQLQAIIENLQNNVVIIDKHGKYLYKSGGYKGMFKSDAKDIWTEYEQISVFDFEGNPILRDDICAFRVLKGETVLKQKLKIVVNGIERYYQTSGIPILKQNNELEMGIGIIFDITEVVISSKQLKEQNELLETILNNIFDAIIVSDNQGRMIRANSEFKKMFTNKEDVNSMQHAAGKLKYFNIGGVEIEAKNMPIARALRGENVRNSRVIVKSDIKEIIADINAAPIYDDTGNIIMTVSSCHDVTMEVQMNETIRRNEKELEAIINNMPDALFIMNPDGSYRYRNKCANEMIHDAGKIKRHGDSLNYVEFYDINGKKLSKGELPGARVLTGENINNFMVKVVDANKITYLSFNASPAYDDNGNMVAAAVSARNISEYVESERESKKNQLKLLKAEYEKNEALEKAIKMKDEFLSLISHEFKTPLNVINSAIQAINYIHGETLPENAKKYIKMIQQNSYRQLRLVNNLLDVTQSYAGQLKTHKKNIDIVFLTKDIVESVNTYALQKEINLSFICKLNNNIVALDDEKYERILLNLISNAIKFTSKGGTIIIRLQVLKNDIRIDVKDNGIGIPEDKVDLIFERFGQVDSSLSRQAEGSGIGLSLVKELVESLDGRISLKSKIGKGSTFTIWIPNKKVLEKEEDKEMINLLGKNLVENVDIEFADIYL